MPLNILNNSTSSKSKHTNVCSSCASASIFHFWLSGHKLMLDAKQLQALAQQL